jgi:uncharacterized membrane protein SpoIIM required for sporulation
VLDDRTASSQRANMRSNFRAAGKTIGRIITVVVSTSFLYLAYFICWLSSKNIVAIFICATCGLAFSIALVWIRFTRSGRSTLARSQDLDWSGTITATVELVALSTAGLHPLV